MVCVKGRWNKMPLLDLVVETRFCWLDREAAVARHQVDNRGKLEENLEIRYRTWQACSSLGWA